MQKVVLDASTRAKLHDLAESLEVVDESGRVLGHFLPLDRSAVAGDASRKTAHTDEEIEHLRKQKGGRPLADIWKDLRRSS